LITASGHYLGHVVPHRESDFVKGEMDYDGFHVAAFVYADKSEDLSKNKIDAAGNYFYSIRLLELQDFAANRLSYDGEYRSIFVYSSQSDNAYDKLNLQGLYYFNKAAHIESDFSNELLNLDGFYQVRFVPIFPEEQVSVSLYPSGHYITGQVNMDQKSDQGKEFLTTEGNYFFRFISGGFSDSFSHSLNLDGLYFPRFVLANPVDHARSYHDLRGIYHNIYAYANPMGDITRNRLDAQGRYFYIYSPNKYSDNAKLLANFDGDYFYGKPTSRYVENAFNQISFIDSTYFTRFVPAYGKSPAETLIQIAGEYTRESWLSVDSTVLTIDFASQYIAFQEITEYATLNASISGVFNSVSESETFDYWLEIYKRPTYNMGKTLRYFSI